MFLKNKFLKKTSSYKADLHNPKILEVNLIKDEGQVYVDRRKNYLTLAAVLFFASLFVAELYFGLAWWGQQEGARAQVLSEAAARLKKEIAQTQSQVAPALAYKEKSAVFSNIISNHIYWSNFLNWLEKNTLSSVSYSGLSGDLTGVYSLEAKTNTLADVSWQVKSFLNDPLTLATNVAAVEVGSKKKDENAAGSVSFSLLLKVKPEIFNKK